VAAASWQGTAAVLGAVTYVVPVSVDAAGAPSPLLGRRHAASIAIAAVHEPATPIAITPRRLMVDPLACAPRHRGGAVGNARVARAAWCTSLQVFRYRIAALVKYRSCEVRA
jgi:hypothetical protein